MTSIFPVLSEAQSAILKRVSALFFGTVTQERLRDFLRREKLQERIRVFYAQGYPADASPSQGLPEEESNLLYLCTTLASRCYFREDKSLFHIFLALRPPVLFFFCGLAESAWQISASPFLAHYSPEECVRLLPPAQPRRRRRSAKREQTRRRRHVLVRIRRLCFWRGVCVRPRARARAISRP